MIADDHSDIAKRAADMRAGKLPDLTPSGVKCQDCRDAGWVADPRDASKFAECALCHNRFGKPAPNSIAYAMARHFGVAI